MDAYRNELAAFVNALRDKAPMPITVQDGMQALRLAECALRSAQTGQSVRVQDLA